MADGNIVTSVVEKKHIINLLETGRRLDGRALDEFRDINVETKFVEKAEGSALLELGKTKVIAGVKILLGTPYSDYPNKGTLIVTAELNPTASPEYRLGPPSVETIELSRVTDRLIRESECIDLEDLCIVEGKHVFSVFIDIYPIDDNGNLFDAAAMAAIAALHTAKVPEYELLDDGTVELKDTFRPLRMKAMPISVTAHKIGSHIIYDPSVKEVAASDARLTFGYTKDYIVSGQKGGEGTFSKAEILDIAKVSMKKADKIRDHLTSMVNK